MSWSFTIPKTPRDAFFAAVRNADASQPIDATPGTTVLLDADLREGARRLEHDLNAVKQQILTYAGRWPDAAYFAASASGHTILPGQGHNWHNGSSFSVSAWAAEKGETRITGDVPEAIAQQNADENTAPGPAEPGA